MLSSTRTFDSGSAAGVIAAEAAGALSLPLQPELGPFLE